MLRTVAKFYFYAKISSFTLISDTNYIAVSQKFLVHLTYYLASSTILIIFFLWFFFVNLQQNAARIARAMSEMTLKRGKSSTALKLRRLLQSIDRRMWWNFCIQLYLNLEWHQQWHFWLVHSVSGFVLKILKWIGSMAMNTFLLAKQSHFFAC